MFCLIQKMHTIQYNEHKLNVVGALLLSNNVDEGSRLLQALNILEDVDILGVAQTLSAMDGILQ